MTILEILGIVFLCHIILNMGFIKEINELPLSTKAIIVSIVIFLPCWSTILYFFFPAILNLEWYKILGFAFVPTFIWYVLEYASVKLGFSIITKHYTFTISPELVWIITLLDGLFYLTIFTLIAFYSHISFEKYLWITFSFRMIFFVCLFILDVIDKKTA